MLRYGLLIFCMISIGCSNQKRKRLETRESLWRLDKIPYGTKYAFENLNYIFPHADIRVSSRFPILFRDDTSRALIIISPWFAPEPNEMNAIIRFAASGNQVFISAESIADTVLHLLHMKTQESDTAVYNRRSTDSVKSSDTAKIAIYRKLDSLKKTDSGELMSKDFPLQSEISILDPQRNAWVKYEYPGTFYDWDFGEVDSGYSTVLGRNYLGKPDFIRIPYAHGGAIFIHLEPLAFSNFFLLHKNNKSYYDLALSYLPANTGVVEWSDYFRYRHRADYFSALHFILANRSLRWAFWLTMLLFLLIFLIESKRKQRSIAVLPILRNASEDFVKTVGRLYFQQKNNQNLAGKMTAAFLENIRTTYNLSTSQLNEEFVHKLAFRAGRPVQEVSQLIESIHSSRLNPDLSDQEIMDLHQQINQFNKQV
jgi:hypothetical protein